MSERFIKEHKKYFTNCKQRKAFNRIIYAGNQVEHLDFVQEYPTNKQMQLEKKFFKEKKKPKE